ncbi:VOC family protein [Rhodococcoides yunnanense]|uniref:VOC family protein n=1 Tax=Rhodococcoides yunnanense TaxID=278209 RepID=UPI000934CDB7|nr:VOC family protein [Rhodococcus yunnanensis]
MLILGSTVIGARDIPRATRFWCAALGLTAGEPKAGGGFTNLFDAKGKLQLSIQNSSQPAEHTPRLHLDLYAPDAAGQKAEVARLLSLGAQTVDWDYPEGADFVVLADTEDNRFCVVDNTGAPDGFRLDFPDID